MISVRFFWFRSKCINMGYWCVLIIIYLCCIWRCDVVRKKIKVTIFSSQFCTPSRFWGILKRQRWKSSYHRHPFYYWWVSVEQNVKVPLCACKFMYNVPLYYTSRAYFVLYRRKLVHTCGYGIRLHSRLLRPIRPDIVES